MAFAPQERETEAAFDLPVELRNDIARLEIAGERSAGAVQLLDKRWRRRAIGIVSGSTNDTAQPLAGLDVLSHPGAGAVRRCAARRSSGAPQQAITQFLDQKLPMIVLADVGTLSPEIRERLSAWIEQGGVLVRFAGPRLAQADDDLVPVKLRRGGRSLGGSLTWEKPQHLASFAADGPFAGLAVPKDITVNRQVLAEPDAVLATKSWASLVDGTPLVTGEHRGKGLVTLFHVSADMRWSDLPMSGTFVEMLRRIVDISGYTSNPGAGVAGEADRRDGGAAAHAGRFWRVRTAALDRKAAAGRLPRPRHHRSSARLLRTGRRPARGQYAGGGGPHRAARYLGLARAPRQLHQCRAARSARHPAVVVAGAVPDRCDHRGAARRRHRRAAAAARRAGGAGVRARPVGDRWRRPSPSRADGNDDFAIKAVAQTHLAYVVTGNADVDSIVKAGMSGLTLFLAQRTALEAGDPVGIDPAHDELAFFPLIYWPVVPGAPKPPQDAINRIDAYMKQGGTVLFDTRDAIEAPPGPNGESQTPGMLALRNILSSLDVPELEPVPREHVLTKTFYLLRDFPGRFNSGPDLGRDAAARGRRRGRLEARARRRRRLADHHHLERSRRRLGAAARRPADAAVDAGRTAAARIRLPRRRQHRDVHPDRQLQGRSGARAGADRTAGAVAMQYGIAFTPLVPSLVLWIALAAIVVIAGLLLLGRARGAAVRVAALALILLALANPSFTREEREPLSSVAAVVVDKSPSQGFGERTRETAQAQEALVNSLKQIKGLEVRVVEAGQADGETDGTKLFGALSSALSDVPTDRVAGAFLITDGRVHDVPANAAALGFTAPVHALITGRKDERDRRIAISAAPRFGIVGQTQTITYRLDDQGVSGERAKVVVRRDGEVINERTLAERPDRQHRYRHQACRPQHRRDRGVAAGERTDAGQQPRRGRDRRRARQTAGAAGFRRAACRRAHLAQPAEIRRQRRSRAFHDFAAAGKTGRHADQRIVADRISDPRTVPAEDQRIPV